MDAEADLLVLPRPVGPQPLVARRPRRAAVARLEQADPLHDRPEVRRVVAVRHDRGDAEMARRLVRRVVPGFAAGLARERRQQRPALAAVAALEEARRLDADEDAPVRHGERRYLRDLAGLIRVVGEALAGERPRSHRGRCCARRPSRAIRSRRRRRSHPTPDRERRGRRASSRRTVRAASSCDGRPRSRAGNNPSAFRVGAVSVASSPPVEIWVQVRDGRAARNSSAARPMSSRTPHGHSCRRVTHRDSLERKEPE